MEMNLKKQFILAMVLLAAFIGVSFKCIDAPMETLRSDHRSTELKQLVKKNGNITRIDYIDTDGNLQIAADVGYASKLIIQHNDSEIEMYYDNYGERISQYCGYYSVLREYDQKGNNTRITYLDDNNHPMVMSLNYAIEERSYNEDGQLSSCRYLDEEGKPACSYNHGFGMRNEYDEKGHRVMITYLDETGEPMLLTSGYSNLMREYYETDGPENGKIRREFYFLTDGSPAALSMGQYGRYNEYDENGQISLTIYLDAAGSPIVTKKGYTSVSYTYYADNSIQSTLYYDINGNPFRMSEGQYGTKNKNGQTIYLNADGSEQFNIKNYVYNHSGSVIVIAIILVIFSGFIEVKMNWLMLVIYIGVIVYFTLMYRESGGTQAFLLRSYSRFFINAEIRASIIKNIWLFVPLGSILSRLCSRKTVLFVPIILSIIIEIVQYFTGMGLCELDDVISNGLGSAIGYGMNNLVQMIRRQFSTKGKNM